MTIKIASLLTLMTLVCLPPGAGAQAGSTQAAPVLSGEDIAKALQQRPAQVSRSRGLSRIPPAAPSISLNIPFKYNSSTLQPQASSQLKQLELALTSDSLRKDRFAIAGHTDAKGNPQYNKQLSLRRAESVKRFLTTNGVETGRLDAVGYGSEQPLTPDQPDAPANRRVEIRDLGPAADAH